MKRYLLLYLLPALLCSGCAVNPKEPFGEVSQEVESRTGYEVSWRLDGDPQVTAAVSDLLAGPLTPEGAVQVALLNNPELQAIYENLGIAQADLVQAGLLKNPVFEGVLRFVRHDGRTVEAGVMMDFLDVFMLPMRKRVAQAELETAQAQVTAAVLDMAFNTRTAFYRLQADRQRVDLQRTILKAADSSYEAAKRLHEAGNIPDLRLFTERAAYEQARLDLSSVEMRLVESRETLNELMGLWGDATHWEVAEGLREPVEAPAPDYSGVLENSLDLGIARNRLKATARRLGVKNITSVIDHFEAGVDADREPDGTWAMGPAIGLPLPLFDQGQAVRARARAQLRQAWDRYTAEAIRVRKAARLSRERLRVARERTDYYNEVVIPLQERILQQTQLRYNGMFLGVFQLLQAKQMETAVRQRYIQELLNYWLARAEYEQLLAGRRAGGGPLAIPQAGAAMGEMSGGGH
jgi:cobalt-zinc-cadmium efflux system outer membrane protein